MVLWQLESAIVRIDNDETMLSSLFDERSLSRQLIKVSIDYFGPWETPSETTFLNLCGPLLT